MANSTSKARVNGQVLGPPGVTYVTAASPFKDSLHCHAAAAAAAGAASELENVRL